MNNNHCTLLSSSTFITDWLLTETETLLTRRFSTSITSSGTCQTVNDRKNHTHMIFFDRPGGAFLTWFKLALWRTAPGDAVLERSIKNRCIKNSEGPATQHANLGTKQVVSLCYPIQNTLCRRYIQFLFVRYFTWIPWIFRSASVSVAGNQMALSSVLLCVLRHTIMTSPTCALT